MRAKKGEYGAAPELKVVGNRRSTSKTRQLATHRPARSPLVNRRGIETGSHRWEASSLTSQPPRPQQLQSESCTTKMDAKKIKITNNCWKRMWQGLKIEHDYGELKHTFSGRPGLIWRRDASRGLRQVLKGKYSNSSPRTSRVQFPAGHSQFSPVGILPNDNAGRRVFSGISHVFLLPATTPDCPRLPVTTRDYLRQLTTTCDYRRQLSTTGDNFRLPATTFDYPRQPETIRGNPSGTYANKTPANISLRLRLGVPRGGGGGDLLVPRLRTAELSPGDCREFGHASVSRRHTPPSFSPPCGDGGRKFARSTDENTSRQFRTLRVAAMAHLMCVAVSTLSPTRSSASNAGNSSQEGAPVSVDALNRGNAPVVFWRGCRGCRFAQLYQNATLILVDSGATDETPALTGPAGWPPGPQRLRLERQLVAARPTAASMAVRDATWRLVSLQHAIQYRHAGLQSSSAILINPSQQSSSILLSNPQQSSAILINPHHQSSGISSNSHNKSSGILSNPHHQSSAILSNHHQSSSTLSNPHHQSSATLLNNTHQYSVILIKFHQFSAILANHPQQFSPILSNPPHQSLPILRNPPKQSSVTSFIRLRLCRKKGKRRAVMLSGGSSFCFGQNYGRVRVRRGAGERNYPSRVRTRRTGLTSAIMVCSVGEVGGGFRHSSGDVSAPRGSTGQQGARRGSGRRRSRRGGSKCRMLTAGPYVWFAASVSHRLPFCGYPH
ncbi:hypothetical protein PR048_000679 [Dryococelus australis]|uniref:Uncharacterized protein n=1 Tax=Dryococelus australis TaxID=614101 RepID=A0ABQ9IFB6_9NEOP|nr:hypothetical protein PR048_000679 [Dryococelus australis]